MVFIPDERHLCHPFYVKTIKELKVIKDFVLPEMVGPGGLEPPTPALSTRCSNQLSYEPKFLKEFDWWSRSGSNRRPPECKSGALPTELRPH